MSQARLVASFCDLLLIRDAPEHGCPIMFPGGGCSAEMLVVGLSLLLLASKSNSWAFHPSFVSSYRFTEVCICSQNNSERYVHHQCTPEVLFTVFSVWRGATLRGCTEPASLGVLVRCTSREPSSQPRRELVQGGRVCPNPYRWQRRSRSASVARVVRRVVEPGGCPPAGRLADHRISRERRGRGAPGPPARVVRGRGACM